MDVIILPELLEELTIISKSGEYVAGKFIANDDSETTIQGAVFPIDQKSLTLLPEGSTYNNSVKIYCKTDIDDLSEVYIVRKSTNITYRIHNVSEFRNIDTLRLYLATVDKDGE